MRHHRLVIGFRHLPPPIDPAERAVFGQNYDALAAFNRDIFDVAQFVDRILVRPGR